VQLDRQMLHSCISTKVGGGVHFTYAELEENDVDLKKLQSWLEKIRKLDFYGATLAPEAERHLQACEGLLEAYAQRVFEAHDENR